MNVTKEVAELAQEAGCTFKEMDFTIALGACRDCPEEQAEGMALLRAADPVFRAGVLRAMKFMVARLGLVLAAGN